MKDIRSIHRKAIALLKEASAAQNGKDTTRYSDLLKEAFELEKEAAYDLAMEFDAEPTRGVLFRSAASLAFQLGYTAEAVKLTHLALAGNVSGEVRLELERIGQSAKLRKIIRMPRAYESIPGDMEEAIISQQTLLHPASATQRAYLDILKKRAVNYKLLPKDSRYSHAIVVDFIVEFLRNIQSAFWGFTEVTFRKLFRPDEIPEYEKLIALIRKDTKALCVDLSFSSFGVSISADMNIMNYQFLDLAKFASFKKEVFESFKEEVLLAEYNAPEYLKMIEEKYGPAERAKIFTPIVSSFKEQSRYKIEICDENFGRSLRQIPSLKKDVIEVLKPVVQTSLADEQVYLKRTYELTTSEGRRRSMLLSEKLDYFEMTIVLKDLRKSDKQAYFIDPYSLKVVFDHGVFEIDDQRYRIFVTETDYEKLLENYAELLLEKFDILLRSETLTFEDAEVLDLLKKTIIKGW